MRPRASIRCRGRGSSRHCARACSPPTRLRIIWNAAMTMVCAATRRSCGRSSPRIGQPCTTTTRRSAAGRSARSGRAATPARRFGQKDPARSPQPNQLDRGRMTNQIETQTFTVGIMLYPDFDLLDIAGPYEVFTFFDGSIIDRDVKVVTVAQHKAPVKAAGGLMVTPECDFECCPPIDLLFVPGAGPGMASTIDNDAFLDFLRQTAAGARYVTSVCTGGILLASAGGVAGRPATTPPALILWLQ